MSMRTGVDGRDLDFWNDLQILVRQSEQDNAVFVHKFLQACCKKQSK